MKSVTIKPVLGAIAIALLLSTTGCTAMTGETAGQYVDDSTNHRRGEGQTGRG
jgi:hypothetical protein